MIVSGGLVGCTDEATSETAQQIAAPGSLIKAELSSTVGVLLDDIPAGPMREAAAADALAKPASFWIDRASRQIRLLNYRLVFRFDYYSSGWSNAAKHYGPLPLPDKSVWNVHLVGTPHRVSAVNGQNHDTVLVDYAFDTMIVSDVESPGKVDPYLGVVGGAATESFNLPTDPDLLLQRTGYACMDEDEYPPFSVFEENTYYFYDDTCTAGSSYCHITEKPSESCTNALNKRTGLVKTAIRFTRIAYDAAIANQYRVGTIVNPNGADLQVVQSAMADERRFAIRYFAPGACELEEGVIAELGWRRVLMFSATVENNGTQPIHIGDVSDPTNPWVASNAFEFSACHGHYHFSHYGTFNYNGAPGSKRAFCLEDTNRFHNDETTPLTADHQACEFQGIGPGWGDEYQFGIPGQWVDVTDVDTKKAHDLTFDSNPDAFMCEGTPVLDGSGQLIFDSTSLTNSNGDPVSRIRCTMPATWHDNNLGAVSVSSPGGSFVTEACRVPQVGANRDCGFTAQSTLRSCAPGSTVNLTCKNTGAAQAFRICEKSAALGGTACTLRDSIRTSIVAGTTSVSFACPAVRDQAGAGGYSVYTASVVPAQGNGSVSCTGW